jgi:hypothetical protein
MRGGRSEGFAAPLTDDAIIDREAGADKQDVERESPSRGKLGPFLKPCQPGVVGTSAQRRVPGLFLKRARSTAATISAGRGSSSWGDESRTPYGALLCARRRSSPLRSSPLWKKHKRKLRAHGSDAVQTHHDITDHRPRCPVPNGTPTASKASSSFPVFH